MSVARNRFTSSLPCLLVALSAVFGLLGLPAGATEGRKWGVDEVGQAELAAPNDPTFESVADYFPMLQRPREAIGVPEAMREFIVLPQGEINLNNYQMDEPGKPERYCYVAPENAATLYFLIGPQGDKTRYGDGIAPDAKTLLDGYLPMVLIPFTLDGIEYRQLVFGWSEGMDPDARLWAYVGLEVINPTDQPARVELAHQAVCGQVPRFVPTGNWQFDLAAGERRRVCLRFPRDGIVPDAAITEESEEFENRTHKPGSTIALLPFAGGFKDVEEVEPAEFDRRLEETAGFWRTLLNRGMTIRTPEQRVNDAYRAWLAYTFLNVDKVGDLYSPRDGAGFYEYVFGIIAAKYCRALDTYSYPDKAGQYLDSLLAMVEPDGELKTGFGLSDAGSLLVAVEQHWLYTRDKQWLAAAAPTMVRMCDWIIARRAREKEGQAPELPNYGLIKYRPSADFPQPDYNYVSDTMLCVGLEAAARALGVLGMDADAERIAAEGAAYRADIDRSMERAIFEHEGDRLLPILPASRGWLAKANYAAFCYYSLFGPMVLESGFFEHHDPRAKLIADAMETRGGLIAGASAFASPRAVANRPEGTPASTINHAFTYGYWEEMLRRNEPEKVILGLYGSMAYGMNRTTYGGVEMSHFRSGSNSHTIPHLRSGTQQLRLLRAMLVREEGDRLVLAQAAPQHWLQAGQKVEVRDAPTFFGPVSYTIVSASDRGRITVDVTPPQQDPPKEIRVFVRHPEGRPIQRVTLAGEPYDTFDDGSITLRGIQDQVIVELHYE